MAADEHGQLNTTLGIGLISLGSLLLEIALTRLFSVLFFPPSVFAILSLAIFGIGLGAAATSLYGTLRQRSYVPRYLAGGAMAALLIVVLSTIPALHKVLFGVVIIPYIFVGMSLTTLFSDAPAQSPRLYLADLLGAGLGSLLAIPVLNVLGGMNAVIFAAVLLAIAGILIQPAPAERIAQIASAGAAVILISNAMGSWLTIPIQSLTSNKPIQESLSNPSSEIIQTKWDAFARTDLIDPGDGGPYRLYMDGAAGSVMPPAGEPEFLFRDIGFFPFATEQPERVFVIGPGGGLDIWFGLQANAKEITAVEVNPASVTIVKEFADYNGGLYDDSIVNVVVDEGRSVLKRSEQEYDLIFMSQVVTLTSERNGYALAENNSYTVEAFEEYLNHLAPGGQIGIKLYDEPTLTRATATAIEALTRQGLTDQEATEHIIVLVDARVSPAIPLLIVGKEPFSEDDALSLGAVANSVGFTPLFLPGVVVGPPLDMVASGESTFDEIIEPLTNNLAPTTDNQPFFYQFEQGLPVSLKPLLWGAGVVVGLGAVALVIAQMSIPSMKQRWYPLYFAALGFGFILIEIAMIQQTRLFLGHPTPATAAVIGSLLIGGGIGSEIAGHIWKQQELPFLPMIAVTAYAAVWLFVWPVISNALIASETPLRTLVVVAALLPLGMLMGMPFPMGLRTVAEINNNQVAAAWAVNGVMSVVGSIAAVALAITSGFTVVLLVGGAAYLIATVMTFILTD